MADGAYTFGTDQPLWYDNGVWGELGFAVPNFGDDPSTLNSAIHRLVSVIGRNLQAIMLHPDANMRTPPSINTLTRIHKLVLRARTILASRDVLPNEPNMESVHASPSEQEFLIYPMPYFKVRNSHLKEYCGLALDALSEAMQHTENAKPLEISTAFSGLIGQYFHRIYRLMATELFGVDAEAAKALDFTMADQVLGTYDPGKFFTSTEMIDTPPRFETIPTEDDLKKLTDGIPATLLVGLKKYPSGLDVTGTASSSTAIGGSTTGSFAPAPGP